MSTNQILVLIIVTVVLLLLDQYILNAFTLSGKHPGRKSKWIFYSYWAITILTLLSVFIGIFLNIGRLARTIILVWFFINYFSKLFIVPFLFIDDLRRFFIWLKRKIYFKKIEKEVLVKNERESKRVESTISRSDFLVKTGLVVASIPFASMNIGMLSGAYDYKVIRKKIVLPNLPKAFEGIKIGQISDIHSGSFYNKTAVQGGVDMLNAEKCDVVLFTGDLVNDRTSEMNNYMDIFSKVKAPMGVYSVLGNHDYGDYMQWSSQRAKDQNLEDLKTVHKNLGWRLLMNENVLLEQGGEKLAIIGIENWGAIARFPRKGRMDLAVKGTEEAAVKLLLSHDPSHWNAQVTKSYKDIDVMFAGHTHGMQFGIRLGDFQWSPAQYVYKEWGGLYHKEQQQLYVNVGYGFLGYPGRVGILPEITIFELKSA